MIKHDITLTDQEVEILDLLLGGAMEQSTFMPNLSKEQADVAEGLLFRIHSNRAGSITDAEIDGWGKFSDHDKEIIKKAYSEHEEGFFPNPFCALK